MGDTFMVWPHRTEVLQDFLQHLTNLHPNIKFMLELEKDTLPCLDVPAKRSLMAHWVILFTENHLTQSLNIMQHKNKPVCQHSVMQGPFVKQTA